MKRAILAVIIGGAVFGSVFAMAASLGLSSNNLGAGDDTVAACDTAVEVTYTTAFDTTNSRFEVENVILNLDAACDGQEGKVTLTGANSLNVEKTFDADATSKSVSFAADNIAAEDVEGVHAVITEETP